MKFSPITLAILAVIAASVLFFSFQNTTEPWTEKQLMEPADLAKIIRDSSAKKPLLFSIGFGGGIKGSIDMGASRDKVNLDKFEAALSKLPKDADIVIYCGCCPFKPCPNIRPAFRLLNDMKFTNHKLLNLRQNLKTDWIDKGYAEE
ncbi:MAG TPA: rhodanese-like domain-containing protein [Bacteroidia bacterium]|nr:rhodanese-like domain-containing protein [Bacteroidia bacterium]